MSTRDTVAQLLVCYWIRYSCVILRSEDGDALDAAQLMLKGHKLRRACPAQTFLHHLGCTHAKALSLHCGTEVLPQEKTTAPRRHTQVLYCKAIAYKLRPFEHKRHMAHVDMAAYKLRPQSEGTWLLAWNASSHLQLLQGVMCLSVRPLSGYPLSWFKCKTTGNHTKRG